MDAIQFYRQQMRRYLLPALAILILDFLFLFVLVELPWPVVVAGATLIRTPLVAVLSGSLGGFVRFLVAEPIAVEKLNDTANMFRYWSSLAVGAVLGLFSCLLLMDARLLKFFYPTVSLGSDSAPSAVSAALFGLIAGLLAKEIVVAGQKRLTSESKQN